MFRIHMLPAEHGDCLWIEYGDGARPNRILIDAGTPGTYPRALKPKIEKVVSAEGCCRFELFVVTHIDADHIGGAIEFLSDSFNGTNGVEIEHVWFNGYCHLNNSTPEFLGAVQGERLTPLVQDGPWKWNEHFSRGAVVVPDEGSLPVVDLKGMRIVLLSPTLEKLQKLKPQWEKECARARILPGRAYSVRDLIPDGFLGGNVESWAAAQFKEDKAEPNGSSIAFAVEYEGKRVLFGADAHPSVLINSLALAKDKPDGVQLTALKLPHHASKNNVSAELIAAFPAEHYLISTNGRQFGHPDKEAIARILTVNRSPNKVLHFNCPSDYNAEWRSKSHELEWEYRAIYGTIDEGLLVEL